MTQQIQPQQLQAVQAPLNQVTVESFTTVVGIIMSVWAGAWVLQQVLKVFKGEAVEKPPLLK